MLFCRLSPLCHLPLRRKEPAGQMQLHMGTTRVSAMLNGNPSGSEGHGRTASGRSECGGGTKKDHDIQCTCEALILFRAEQHLPTRASGEPYSAPPCRIRLAVGVRARALVAPGCTRPDRPPVFIVIAIIDFRDPCLRSVNAFRLTLTVLQFIRACQCNLHWASHHPPVRGYRGCAT